MTRDISKSSTSIFFLLNRSRKPDWPECECSCACCGNEVLMAKHWVCLTFLTFFIVDKLPYSLLCCPVHSTKHFIIFCFCPMDRRKHFDIFKDITNCFFSWHLAAQSVKGVKCDVPRVWTLIQLIQLICISVLYSSSLCLAITSHWKNETNLEKLWNDQSVLVYGISLILTEDVSQGVDTLVWYLGGAGGQVCNLSVNNTWRVWHLHAAHTCIYTDRPHPSLVSQSSLCEFCNLTDQ